MCPAFSWAVTELIVVRFGPTHRTMEGKGDFTVVTRRT
jgi:hypothetical protein